MSRSPVSPTTPLADIFRLTPTQKTGLTKLGVTTAIDLLRYFPTRYTSIAELRKIRDLKKGDDAIIYARVVSAKTSKGFRSKIPMTEAVFEDDTGHIKAVWFHQAYIAKMLPEGKLVKIAGHVEERKGIPYLANPEFEDTKDFPIDGGTSLWGEGSGTPTFSPVYAETKGVTSRFLYHHVQKLFTLGILDITTDPIPSEILKRYHLPTLTTALVWIHTPKREEDARAARKRFAFEEVFLIQLARAEERRANSESNGFVIDPQKAAIARFVERFPFRPTNAQTHALENIFADLKKGTPMGRLLEGDVGSGKTFVAATAAYAVATSAPLDNKFGNLQVAYMAPTEILAEQHFKSFTEYFKDLPIEIGLLTGSTAKKFPSKIDPSGATKVSKAQLLKWVAEGKLPILIGTHALIQKNVKFKNFALAIVDEQHRFGTAQRGKLAKKEALLPHFLSMTATPIPRTLALTIYGNLDLTVIDHMPEGRKPIKTELVLPTKRTEMEKHIKTELNTGRQAYIICPRIDEPDPEKERALGRASIDTARHNSAELKSVKEEAKRLARVFPAFSIGILHGKMKPLEKDQAMHDFASGKTQILVATSVVEVGVNVPNATIIVIEGAERFGLAQLHQLRGRVLRGTHQAYCHLLTTSTNEATAERLKALVTAKNGFELAELDLMLRGAGELGGGKQWGISDLGMEAIKNIKMVEAARTEAQTLIASDPALHNHPLLRIAVDTKLKGTHWE